MKISKEYRTIIVLVSGFIIISYLFSSAWLLYFSLGILFVSSINSRITKRIAKLWISFGNILGAINSRVILSIFFVFILTPLSYIKKLLESTPKRNHNTNWIRVKEDETINFNNPW